MIFKSINNTIWNNSRYGIYIAKGLDNKIIDNVIVYTQGSGYGIDIETISKIQKENRPSPTIALIGRVVPIKDIKTFIRCVHFLKQVIPDINVFIMGATEEDPEYFDYDDVAVLLAIVAIGLSPWACSVFSSAHNFPTDKKRRLPKL